MYMPPLNSILSRLGVSRDDFDNDRVLPIPAPLLRLLIQMALTSIDFNEDGYLAQNPDIKYAIRRKTIDSALLHYIGFGYFEGRLGATPEVDEAWYLRTYDDVAEATSSGKVGSAAEHFAIIGAAEGRSPNADYQAEARQWKHALQLVPR
jgi:hypothetical protein